MPERGREVIGRLASPIAIIGACSLAFVLGIGTLTNPRLAALAAETSPSVLLDGRPPTSVSLVVDGVPTTLITSAQTVGELLTEENVAFDNHDIVQPSVDSPLQSESVVRVTHIGVWTETVRQPIAAPVKNVPSFRIGPGKTKVLEPGSDGMKELTYIVTRGSDRAAPPRRSMLSAHVVRAARPRVVAQGVAEYALSQIAERGFDATVRFAGAAMKMIATAYTAHCAGCSGFTKTGAPAGHGIVAVDPRVIPLGTALFIPGYGRAIAGDTGSAIRGNRIDLGFNSTSDAFRFGTRPITVYILH